MIQTAYLTPSTSGVSNTIHLWSQSQHYIHLYNILSTCSLSASLHSCSKMSDEHFCIASGSLFDLNGVTCKESSNFPKSCYLEKQAFQHYRT